MTDQELIGRVLKEHWLVMDGDRAIAGCHCGFVAETDSDCGYGDSVLKHFAGMVIASARKAVAAEIRAAMPESARHTPRQTWVGMCDAYRHSADIAGGAPTEGVGMYDIARLVTDEVLGSGTYEALNGDHPDPDVRAAIERGRAEAAGSQTNGHPFIDNRGER